MQAKLLALVVYLNDLFVHCRASTFEGVLKPISGLMSTRRRLKIVQAFVEVSVELMLEILCHVITIVSIEHAEKCNRNIMPQFLAWNERRDVTERSKGRRDRRQWSCWSKIFSGQISCEENSILHVWTKSNVFEFSKSTEKRKNRWGREQLFQHRRLENN